MKYTAPKLHKLWIKEKIGEGSIYCQTGSGNQFGCLNGSTAEMMCNVGTSVEGTCQTGNTPGIGCSPGYGVT